MTCRHSPGDPECSSSPAYRDRVQREYYESTTPDASKYEIVEVERIGAHLVMKVRYPNCTRCAFEGTKVMVFLNVTEVQVIRWRKIDPHFRPVAKLPQVQDAPSPSARFPASKEGWDDALAYARSKTR